MKKRKNFKRSMLAYCKLILHKMSFSKKLFLKEYRKSFSYLNEEEQVELKRWVRDVKNGAKEGSEFVEVQAELVEVRTEKR